MALLMEMVLQAKDAVEWAYRAEGAVNLVLAYCGNSSNFIGKVLRLQKVSRNGSEYENGHSALTKHEYILWGEVAGIALAPTRKIVEQLYVQQVMCPLLGSEHVDAGRRVLVSREFLEAVENRVLRSRPSWRVDDAKVNPLCDSVLLIADHSVFPPGSSSLCRSPCIKVEASFMSELAILYLGRFIRILRKALMIGPLNWWFQHRYLSLRSSFHQITGYNVKICESIRYIYLCFQKL